MDSERTLEPILQRIGEGDEQARSELLGIAHDRLRQLASVMLHRSFPALQNRHELDSVVNDACVRILKAFDADVILPTPADFFRFAAFKIRQVLLDLAARSRKPGGLVIGFGSEESTANPQLEPSQHTFDPQTLAIWSELHDRAARLEEPKRTVFALRYYLGFTNQQIATSLEMHPKTVSRAWIAATEELADLLPHAQAPEQTS